jgi:hypothetical protein
MSTPRATAAIAAAALDRLQPDCSSGASAASCVARAALNSTKRVASSFASLETENVVIYNPSFFL